MTYDEIDKLLRKKTKVELLELIETKASKWDLEDFVTGLYTKEELEEVLTE